MSLMLNFSSAPKLAKPDDGDTFELDFQLQFFFFYRIYAMHSSKVYVFAHPSVEEKDGETRQPFRSIEAELPIFVFA